MRRPLPVWTLSLVGGVWTWVCATLSLWALITYPSTPTLAAVALVAGASLYMRRCLRELRQLEISTTERAQAREVTIV